MILPSRAVFDSYAILCFLKSEKGADRIQKYLEAARRHRITIFLNMINAGEIFYISYRRAGEQKAFETWGHVKNLPLQIVHNDETSTLQAAHFKGQYSFSYADAFAAATAILKSAVLITGDPEFKPLQEKMQIDWLR